MKLKVKLGLKRLSSIYNNIFSSSCFLCNNLVFSRFDIRLVTYCLQPVRVVSCVAILYSVGSTSDLVVVAYKRFELFSTVTSWTDIYHLTWHQWFITGLSIWLVSCVTTPIEFCPLTLTLVVSGVINNTFYYRLDIREILLFGYIRRNNLLVHS